MAGGDEGEPYLDWRDEFEDWPDDEGPSWGDGPVLICRCFSVEEREIEELVRAGVNLEEIAQRTGATTGCSGCKRQVEAMLRNS